MQQELPRWFRGEDSSFKCRGIGFNPWLGIKGPVCLGVWPKLTNKKKIKK